MDAPKWLEEAGQFDSVPMATGRFAQILTKYESRFGAIYQARSQEAIRCYGALLYLACCSMAGAAAEAIFLTMAITQAQGDEEKVMKEYLSKPGRQRMIDRTLGQQKEELRNEILGGLSLLKYWRDSTSHGAFNNIGDAEAHTALAFLLRLAQTTNDRWDDLVRS